MPKPKEFYSNYVKELRDSIIQTFESLEPSAKFERTPWSYQKGEGGGEISVIRGEHFEKAAVNVSTVSGDTFPMKDSSGPFFATGISLISHMSNPHAPTAHMNIRYIETEKGFWYGGGYDLTPMGFPYEEDTKHFHQVAKETLDEVDKNLYPDFSKQAKEYFYLPHRKSERGVGGLFFDHYNTQNEEKDIQVWKNVGSSLTKALMPILERRIDQAYTSEEKETQLHRRGRYVEFNLLYDRGTKFGIESGGNPNAIFCSLPPEVKW